MSSATENGVPGASRARGGAAERERAHHDRLAAGLDPAAMAPRAPDEWEAALLGRAGELAGRRVLELGCGDGELSLELLARGAELVALDLSPGMVAVARERARRFAPRHAAACFAVAPAEDTGLPAGSFDLAIGKWVLHHLDLDRAARELARLLAPGGRGVFVETSALNPALAWARRRLAGRDRVARFGTRDERPLGRAELDLLRARFARVEVDFPCFWLAQMADRHLFRQRSPAATRACRQADRLLARGLPPLRRYGYWMRVELEAG